MKHWWTFERRWARALLNAMIPTDDERPGLACVDLTTFWDIMHETAPVLLRLGLRVAVWSLTWRCLCWSLKPFHRLPDRQRDRLLQRWGASDGYLTRQLVMTLKVVACFAFFSDTKTRKGFRGLPWT